MAKLKNEFRDRRNKIWSRYHFVYGRKPASIGSWCLVLEIKKRKSVSGLGGEWEEGCGSWLCGVGCVYTVCIGHALSGA
jgi:hypothetical protein